MSAIVTKQWWVMNKSHILSYKIKLIHLKTIVEAAEVLSITTIKASRRKAKASIPVSQVNEVNKLLRIEDFMNKFYEQQYLLFIDIHLFCKY